MLSALVKGNLYGVKISRLPFPGRGAALLQRCTAEPGSSRTPRSARPRLCSAPGR